MLKNLPARPVDRVLYWVRLADAANDYEDLRLAAYCRDRAYRSLADEGRRARPEFRWPCEHGAPVG